MSANLKFEGNWNIIKGKLKQTYGQLTDDDLIYTEGKENEVIGRIQKKLGQTHDQVLHLINTINRE